MALSGAEASAPLALAIVRPALALDFVELF
jgi:hypothetical protein